MFKKYPLASRFVVFVFVPLMVFGIWTVNYANKSLPLLTGTVELPALSFPVSVSRDTHGVAYIEAKTDVDAFTSIGYVHAQDRLWQLEFQKRLAQGKLSEIFGKESLQSDILFRTLGLYESAKIAWKSLSVPARESLSAYTAGINSWIDTNKNLPLEFKLFNIQPTHWTVFDSLAWMKVFALDLSGNYKQELSRMVASGSLTSKQLQFFFPSPSETPQLYLSNFKPETFNKLDELRGVLSSVESDYNIGGRYVGSNAWVVSGNKVDTGQSIISNDPHLGLQIPSSWYVATIRGDKLNVSGMSLVGLPIIVFGKNQDIAWAGTNLMADAQDLFFEKQNVKNSSQYSVDGTWREFGSREEIIQVRADFPAFLRQEIKPLKLEVRSSRHGPIISDLVNLRSEAVALKWTALDDKDTSYEAFFQLNYARDWKNFKESLSYHVAPALNMLFSDVNGNIGYLAAGKIPVRKHGIGQNPVYGDSNDFEWLGYIPAEELPQLYNPASGVIISANNKIVNSSYPYFISADWAPPTRALRILELLEEKISKNTLLSVEDMKAIQSDTLDRPMNKLLNRLLQFEPRTESQQLAFEYLRKWDGDMSRESQAASILYSWVRLLKGALFDDELAGHWNKNSEKKVLIELVDNVGVNSLTETITNNTLNWCDDITTSNVETCNDILSQSLDLAITANQRLLGDSSMESWSWGSMHQTHYKHIPFSNVKILDEFFERRIGNSGSPNTINVASANYNSSDGFVQAFGPGFRQIIELSKNQSKHFYMNSTGQSGNVLSEHYDDMVEPFRNAEYFSLNRIGKDSKRFILTPTQTSIESTP